MSKREKDQRRKRRQKAKAEAAIMHDNVVFDVLGLIRSENTDTKPNMGKFLKQYVRDIRAIISSAVEFYPKFSYAIQRVFVTFLDGHELLFYPGRQAPLERYICTYKYDDQALSEEDVELLKTFFQRLFDFKFIYEQPPAKTPEPEPPRVSESPV